MSSFSIKESTPREYAKKKTRQWIKDQKLKPGDKILSQNKLSRILKIAPETANKALNELAKSGELYRIRGKGTFVAQPKKRSWEEITIAISDYSIKQNGFERKLKDYGDNVKIEIFKDILFEDMSFLKKLDFDIIYTSEDRVPMYSQKDLLMPLDDFLEKSEKLKYADFEKKAIETLSYNGSVYGLPVSFSPIVLFYNKDIFNALNISLPSKSWTWERLVSAASNIVEKYKRRERKIWGLGCYPVNINICFPLVRQNGGEYIDENGKCLINSPEGVQAMQFLADLIHEYKIIPPVDFINLMSFSEMFVREYCPMFIGFYDDYIYLKEHCDLNWDCEILPMMKKRSSPFSVQGWSVAKNSLKIAACLDFLEEFFVHNNGLFSNMPRRIGAYKCNHAQLHRSFIESLDFAKPLHVVPRKFSLQEVYRQLAPLWFGIEDAKTACDKLAEMINSKK